MATYAELKTFTQDAIEEMLLEHKFKRIRLPARDLVALAAALDTEKPSVFNIMTTLANQLEYLTHQYEGKPEHIPVISDFLASFQLFAAQELLSKESTIKQGLALLPDGGA